MMNTRFGIIFLSSILETPYWVWEVLSLFVNLEVLTAAEFASGEKLPTTCVSKGLLIKHKFQFYRSQILEALEHVRTGMTSHAWQWEDPRSENNFMVHFARD